MRMTGFVLVDLILGSLLNNDPSSLLREKIEALEETENRELKIQLPVFFIRKSLL